MVYEANINTLFIVIYHSMHVLFYSLNSFRIVKYNYIFHPLCHAFLYVTKFPEYIIFKIGSISGSLKCPTAHMFGSLVLLQRDHYR